MQSITSHNKKNNKFALECVDMRNCLFTFIANKTLLLVIRNDIIK